MEDSGKQDKILITHYNSRYLPLTEVWIYNQLKKLKDFRIIFLCRSLHNVDLFPGIEVYALEEKSFILQKLNILFSKVFGYIPMFDRKSREAKLLHVHFGYNAIKLTGLKKKRNIPMICSFYGIDAHHFPYANKRNLKKMQGMFIQVDKVLVLGKYMKSQLINLGCPEDKIIIHHLGIYLDKIEFVLRTYNKSRPVRFLLASSFIEKKGVETCLQALINLKNDLDFTVDIIGDGPLKTRIQDIIKSGNLQEKVKMHGYQPYEFFIKLAYDCDVMLQASRTSEANDKEGTPMSLVDAMATGMPVVSTRHGDIPEIVVDGVTGFLAEEGSVVEFEEAISKMMERMEEISIFSRKSRKWIEENFDVEKQSDRLSHIYNNLIEN